MTTATILYGIPNCDACRKARQWLDKAGIAYRFHDVRANGLTSKQVQRWLDALGWETLLNRRGTSWRNLPETARAGLNAAKASRLLLENPTLMKRPLLETGQACRAGFDAAIYARMLR